MSRTEPLTALQEESLAPMIERGDLGARDLLAMSHRPLAVRCARRWRGHLPADEAIGEAMVALVEAANRFRPGIGRFATLASIIIRKRLRAACQKWKAARLSRGLAAEPESRSQDERPNPAVSAVRRAMAVALDEGERAAVRRAVRLGGKIPKGAARKLREHLAG